jgi:hypothetical protein
LSKIQWQQFEFARGLKPIVAIFQGGGGIRAGELFYFSSMRAREFQFYRALPQIAVE